MTRRTRVGCLLHHYATPTKKKNQEVSARQSQSPTNFRLDRSRGMRNYSHGSVSLYGKQMMVTPCQVRGTDDHQPAHITIRRNIAYFGRTTGAQKPLGLHLRMTHAQGRRRGVWQSRRESHQHQISTCTPWSVRRRP